jgi:prepilin peptidase CpaA
MAVPFTLLVLSLLLVAAWRDVATRTIPDAVSLLIAALGAAIRLLDGPSALALSAGTALMLFVVLLIVFSRGLIGGGDVKIMTALAVALPPPDSFRFVVATAIAGGFLAIAYLLLSRRLHGPDPTRRSAFLGRVVAVECWRIRRRGPLPYGVAIAAGGAFVLLHPGSF